MLLIVVVVAVVYLVFVQGDNVGITNILGNMSLFSKNGHWACHLLTAFVHTSDLTNVRSFLNGVAKVYPVGVDAVVSGQQGFFSSCTKGQHLHFV